MTMEDNLVRSLGSMQRLRALGNLESIEYTGKQKYEPRVVELSDYRKRW